MRSLKERFLEKVSKNQMNGCWMWVAALTSQGYGVIGIGGNKTRLAHRVSWQLHKGNIPGGLWVLHKCDIRHCVNPEHLYLGTVIENHRDSVERGRHKNPPSLVGHPEWEEKRISALPRGERHHRSAAKIDEGTAKKIFNAEGSQREIARRFGLCQQAVSLIKRKERWVHIHDG